MVVADRPLLDVESNPAGSHLFLVSSKELLYTAMAGFFFLSSSSEISIRPSVRTNNPGARTSPSPLDEQGLQFCAATTLLGKSPANCYVALHGP